jgi:hypothetical protein
VRTKVVTVVYETEVHKSGTEFSVSPKALHALDLPEDSGAVPTTSGCTWMWSVYPEARL